MSRILEPIFSVYKLLTEQRKSGTRLTQNAKRDPITRRSRTQPSANKQQDKRGKKEHTHTKQNKAVEKKSQTQTQKPKTNSNYLSFFGAPKPTFTKNQPESIKRHIPTFC
jgi:hypothetical protein